MNTPRQHKLWWQSSYDRGLDILLFMWPDIKEAIPDAELHIAYGWQTFDALTANNPERVQWKHSVEVMMNQPGIFHYGRVGREELKKLRSQCGILAYPTYFTEIFFIGGVEAQADGLVPVVSNFTHDIEGNTVYTALDETIGCGIKVEGNIKDPSVQKKYIQELISLMKNKERWRRESIKGKGFAKKFTWHKQSYSWLNVFSEKCSTPKVSVITPTIREGFWNIMADTLHNQTYQIDEWIIVDDHEEDRSEIAKKYARIYGLNIIYIRGDKALGNYSKRCGLVRANNKAWQVATGELLVWLQDFIGIPSHGIEWLVDIYRHNPNALIAPVDEYFDTIEPDQKNKEDWWNDNTQILTQKTWTNPRVKNEGIRESDNPFDFEMNYGAMPKKILEHLNGFWEFMDNGLGFDNTEIAFRAMNSGYKLLVDDTNIAKCINLWPFIGGTSQNILNRERMLNPPRYKWMIQEIESGKLPLIRDTKIDESIKLEFEVPDEVTDEECSEWIRAHSDEIVKKWKESDIYGEKTKTKRKKRKGSG